MQTSGVENPLTCLAVVSLQIAHNYVGGFLILLTCLAVVSLQIAHNYVGGFLILEAFFGTENLNRKLILLTLNLPQYAAITGVKLLT